MLRWPVACKPAMPRSPIDCTTSEIYTSSMVKPRWRVARFFVCFFIAPSPYGLQLLAPLPVALPTVLLTRPVAVICMARALSPKPRSSHITKLPACVAAAPPASCCVAPRETKEIYVARAALPFKVTPLGSAPCTRSTSVATLLTAPSPSASTKTIQPCSQFPPETQPAPSLLLHSVMRLPRRIASLRATFKAVTKSLVWVIMRLFFTKSLKLGTAKVTRMVAMEIVTRSSTSMKPRESAARRSPHTQRNEKQKNKPQLSASRFRHFRKYLQQTRRNSGYTQRKKRKREPHRISGDIKQSKHPLRRVGLASSPFYCNKFFCVADKLVRARSQNVSATSGRKGCRSEPRSARQENRITASEQRRAGGLSGRRAEGHRRPVAASSRRARARGGRRRGGGRGRRGPRGTRRERGPRRA